MGQTYAEWAEAMLADGPWPGWGQTYAEWAEGHRQRGLEQGLQQGLERGLERGLEQGRAGHYLSI